jgi:hypothetical protein
MRDQSFRRVYFTTTVVVTVWTMSGRLSAVAVECDAPASAVVQSPNDPAEPKDKPKYPQGFIKEGPLPEGFPPPSEVGQVVEKSYPLCRTYSATGNNAFMRCFRYLSKEKHEMTAPVIMDYKDRAEPAASRPIGDFDAGEVDRMHFILGNPSIDEPKREGVIVVADMPKMRVLSIAVQGPRSAQVLAEAERKLDAEITKRKELVAAGPRRVLGYNSPMVPREKAFWEVQIPINKRGG